MDEELDSIIIIKSGYISDDDDNEKEFDTYSKLALINEIIKFRQITLNIRNVNRFNKYTRNKLICMVKSIRSQ